MLGDDIFCRSIVVAHQPALYLVADTKTKKVRKDESEATTASETNKSRENPCKPFIRYANVFWVFLVLLVYHLVLLCFLKQWKIVIQASCKIHSNTTSTCIWHTRSYQWHCGMFYCQVWFKILLALHSGFSYHSIIHHHCYHCCPYYITVIFSILSFWNFKKFKQPKILLFWSIISCISMANFSEEEAPSDQLSGCFKL